MKEKTEELNVFAMRLRELRGVESQSSFAAQIEVHPIQYSKYERGINSPSVDVLRRICLTCGCSSDWLLGLREPGGAVTVHGNGNTVANGPHAVAIGGSPAAQPGAAAICRKCPHLKRSKAFEKLMAHA